MSSSADLELTTTTSKNLFFGIRGFTVVAKFRPKTGALAFVDFFLRLLPEVPAPLSRTLTGLTPCSLINYRGRPSESFTPEDSVQLSEGEEELFAIRGQLYPLDAKGSDHDLTPEEVAAEQEAKIPIALQIRTLFKRFSRSGTIEYETGVHCSKSLRENLPGTTPLQLLTAQNCEIDQIRLGWEQFRPRFFGSLLGVAPRNSFSLFLVGSHRLLTLHVTVEDRFNCDELREVAPIIDKSLKGSRIFTGFAERLFSSLPR